MGSSSVVTWVIVCDKWRWLMSTWINWEAASTESPPRIGFHLAVQIPLRLYMNVETAGAFDMAWIVWYPLQWRHNDHDSVSNHQPHGCLLNRLFRRRSKKHQSSASLAFVWGIHRDRWIPRTKGQLRGKCFHLMTSSCIGVLSYGVVTFS